MYFYRYENEVSTGAAISSWLAGNEDKATRADLFITSKARAT
jgi:diketogulonate reductase-like aldo/keto reductase